MFAEVQDRLRQHTPVRVLEVGCGYGTVLLELQARFGAAVDLHGINKSPRDGDADALFRNGVEQGLIALDRQSSHPMPKISFGDVAEGLPFPDDSLDIVYSQVAWLYFGNKIAVLREINRVLRRDGIAKIDADDVRHDLPLEYQRLVEIWQGGRLVPFSDYIRPLGMTFIPAAVGQFLCFGKSPRCCEELEQVLQITLAQIDSRWRGVKCVYRVGPV